MERLWINGSPTLTVMTTSTQAIFWIQYYGSQTEVTVTKVAVRFSKLVSHYIIFTPQTTAYATSVSNFSYRRPNMPFLFLARASNIFIYLYLPLTITLYLILPISLTSNSLPPISSFSQFLPFRSPPSSSLLFSLALPFTFPPGSQPFPVLFISLPTKVPHVRLG